MSNHHVTLFIILALYKSPYFQFFEKSAVSLDLNQYLYSIAHYIKYT